MENEKVTREYIIQTLKELDVKSEKTVGRRALAQKGINAYHISKFIPEGLTQLKEELGLKISRQERPLSENKLFEQLDKVVSKLRRIPTWAEIRRETGTTDKVFRNHFGGIFEVVSKYKKWLEENRSESEDIKLVNEYIKNQGKKPHPRSQSVPKKAGTKGSSWPKIPGIEYGEYIDFRGLRHAPINENGVIFLFGMVSYELGFFVEAIHNVYPDCEAKRCVDRRHNRWQRVRIEFEYKSSNFKDHGHAAQDCDLIVCWKHDWVDCPIEVIELETKIKELLKEVKYH